MTSGTDDDLDGPSFPARRDAIVHAVEPLLVKGDAFVLVHDGAQTVLTPLAANPGPSRSTVQREDPGLYGFLLGINQRIADASGCGPSVLVLALAAAACFALHGRLLHGVFPTLESQVLLDGLRTWWVYGLIAMAALVAIFWLNAHLEARAYWRERRALGERLAEDRLVPYEVVSRIDGDEALATLARLMKRDESFLDSR